MVKHIDRTPKTPHIPTEELSEPASRGAQVVPPTPPIEFPPVTPPDSFHPPSTTTPAPLNVFPSLEPSLNPRELRALVATTRPLLQPHLRILNDPRTTTDERLAAARAAVTLLGNLPRGHALRSQVSGAIRTSLFPSTDTTTRSAAIDLYRNADGAEREGPRALQAFFNDPEISVRVSAMRAVHSFFLDGAGRGYDMALLRRTMRETYIQYADTMHTNDANWLPRAYRVNTNYMNASGGRTIDARELRDLRARISEMERSPIAHAIELPKARFLLASLGAD